MMNPKEVGGPALMIGVAEPKGSPMPGGAGAGSMHAQLEQRFRKLTPEEQQTLSDGVSPEAAAILCTKLLPEMCDVLERALGEDYDGDQGGGAYEASDNDGDEEPAEPGAPMPPQKPRTMLGRM